MRKLMSSGGPSAQFSCFCSMLRGQMGGMTQQVGVGPISEAKDLKDGL